MGTVLVNDARIRTIDFPRFGACTFADDEVLSFPWGLPGFPALRRFIVLQVAGQEGFIWLQSLDDLTVALPMTDPWSLFEDYDPHLPPYAQVALDLRTPDEFVIYNVVVVSRMAREMTINLLAPVVINLRTRVGRQVTLETQSYSVRTEIPRRSAGEAVLP